MTRRPVSARLGFWGSSALLLAGALVGCGETVRVALLSVTESEADVAGSSPPLELVPDGAAPAPSFAGPPMTTLTTDAGGPPVSLPSPVDAEPSPQAAEVPTAIVEAGVSTEPSTPIEAMEVGAPDAGAALDAGAAEPAGLETALAVLVHRYRFGGYGDVAMDSVGGAHGEVIGGAVLDGSGRLYFDGEDDYVNLPNGLISAWDSVTLTAWIEWSGGGCWQRVFDFGSSTEGEDLSDYAETALFITPSSCSASHIGPVEGHVISAQFHVGGQAYMAQHDAEPLLDTAVFLALSASPEGLAVYLDGVLEATLPAPLDVSQIDDVNNWLGRSQWAADPYYFGFIDDFGIYSRALVEEEIFALYAAGPELSLVAVQNE